MFSSEKNIDTIGKLIDVVLHYIKLQNEYVRLGAVEKIVRVITSLAMLLIVALLVIIALIYLSFGAAYALEDILGGLPQAFCVVGAFYVVVLLVISIFRRQLIERPLVKMISKILLKK